MVTRAWWNHRIIIWVVVILVALPLAWPKIPPLLDLPGHMASYYVSLNPDVPPIKDYFSFDWHVIGNLGVDLLIIPFGSVFGVEPGTKAIVILIPVFTTLAFLVISRQVHGRLQATVFAAVPLVYNYPFMFGFVNYSLSLALAMLGFALWLRWQSDHRQLVRAIAFGLIAIAIWLSHAIGWVMFCVMVGAFEFHQQLVSKRGLGRALVSTIYACAPLLLPIPLNALSPHTGGFSAYGFFDVRSILKWCTTLLRDRWISWDIMSVAVLALLLVAATFGRFGLSINARLGWPALALFALYVIAPQSINDSFFVAARIVPYAAALAILAVKVDLEPFHRQMTWACITGAFMLLRLSGNFASFLLYSNDYSKQLQALAYIPRGSAAVTFAPVPCESTLSNWFNPRTYHISGLAVVRNEAFINATWSIRGLQLLRVHYPRAGQFQSDPSDMVYLDNCKFSAQRTLKDALSALPYQAFNRLWLVHVPRDHWPQNRSLRKIWSSGDSVVYAINSTAKS